MNLICPLCNGLIEPRVRCSSCRESMQDVGALVDYLDDYSPYLSKDITQLVDGVSQNECLHILQCYICGHDQKMVVNMIFK